MKEHHWEGLVPQPHKFFGFVYLITFTITGQMYVGKKQFWRMRAGAPKSRSSFINTSKWKAEHWKEADWHLYSGSSKHLTNLISKYGKESFKFEILGQYSSKGDLHYAEIQEQVLRDVLQQRMDDGELLYLNRTIAAIHFIPPNTFSEESKKKMQSNWKNGHPMLGKTHPNKGKKLPQTGHNKNKGKRFFTDGHTNICLSPGQEPPDGFVRGMTKSGYTLSDKSKEASLKNLDKARDAIAKRKK